MGMMEHLVARRRFRIVREILALYGIDFPSTVRVGQNLQLVHRGLGTVIHPDTEIGHNVRIYHQVTIGRADAHLPREQSLMERIEISDDVVLCPGAKILGGPGVTRVGAGTVVAANAVLTCSTGENEVWAGVPARKVGIVT